jgi:hypothetical protein
MRSSFIVLGLAAASSAALQSGIITYSLQSDGSIGNYFDATYNYSNNSLASTGWYAGYGGTAMPAFTGDFSADKTLRLQFSAPAGKSFTVYPPAGHTTTFEVYFQTANSHTTPQYLAATSLSFTGVSGGTAPSTFDAGNFASFYTGSGTFDLSLLATVSGSFSFTGFTVDITVPAEFNTSFADHAMSGAFEFAADGYASDPGLWVTVPEPATAGVAISAGLLGFALWRRRRQG